MPTVFAKACATVVAALLWGCGSESPSAPAGQRELEWVRLSWSGGVTDVGLVRPDEGTAAPHPVLVALPWGAGTPDLVYSFLDAYWAVEPPSRGYYVVSPAIPGSSLAQDGAAFVPALLEWIEGNLQADGTRIALVGASNGGRGIFHAALAAPDRFKAMVGLPGQYSGDGSNLAALTGMPIWLLVGELDASWVEATQATAEALAMNGITARVDTVPGQGHVMFLNSADIMDWIDEAIGHTP